MHELGRRSALEEEAARTRPHRFVDVFVLIEGGQHQHPGGAFGLVEDASSRVDPVHARHPDVHQDDVRVDRGGLVHRVDSILGLAHDLEVILSLDDHPKATAD